MLGRRFFQSGIVALLVAALIVAAPAAAGAALHLCCLVKHHNQSQRQHCGSNSHSAPVKHGPQQKPDCSQCFGCSPPALAHVGAPAPVLAGLSVAAPLQPDAHAGPLASRSWSPLSPRAPPALLA